MAFEQQAFAAAMRQLSEKVDKLALLNK